MKYEKPILLNIAAAASARCISGSNPTHDQCKAGTAGPGSGATTCSTGYEAAGNTGNSGCRNGYAADKRCGTGSAVGANKSACSTGGTASACGTGSKVTG